MKVAAGAAEGKYAAVRQAGHGSAAAAASPGAGHNVYGAVALALEEGLCGTAALTGLVLLVDLRLAEAAFFLFAAIWTWVLPTTAVPSSQESKADAGQLLSPVMPSQIPISSRSVAPGAQLALCCNCPYTADVICAVRALCQWKPGFPDRALCQRLASLVRSNSSLALSLVVIAVARCRGALLW